MNVTAIIPVRAGSRRLKNKNMATFSGSTLLQYKISQLQMVPAISRIVVSSDSDLMLHCAKQAGALTHKRAPEYCDEVSKSFGEVVRHICESVEGEHILWATCTAPLVEPALYQEAIVTYAEVVLHGSYDSLISVQPFKRYVWDENGPLNYRLGKEHVPSQELAPLYFVTDGIEMAPRHKMIEWYYFHGTNPYKFSIDKRAAVDIDDRWDLLQARAWLEANDAE